MSNMVVRYSDADLAEFKDIIDKKLAEAQANLESLQEQIIDITENTSDEHGGDWMDDSNINNEMEMLNNMAIRQRMYIKDLENAQVRIRNKSYGICSITGELIDKKRLLAVPTTTKSLSAKTEEAKTKEDKPAPKPVIKPIPSPENSPKVITKVIRKSGGSTKPNPNLEEEEDFLFDREVFMDEEPEEEEEEDDMMERNVSDMDDFADNSDDDSDY
jgi:RNA polymerase-binding transcription factor DksA